MVKNFFMAFTLGLGFILSSLPASAGYVYVQVGPPAPVVERIPARPHAGYVWVPGYYRWYGGRYVWTRGAYVNHAGAWCQGTWRHTARRGWYWSSGRWC